jgi:hypothetical protein
MILRKEIIHNEILKAVELLELGKKLQFEIDKKNETLKIFEVSVKRVSIKEQTR